MWTCAARYSLFKYTELVSLKMFLIDHFIQNEVWHIITERGLAVSLNKSPHFIMIGKLYITQVI